MEDQYINHFLESLGGVIISMLVSTAEDHGLNPWSVQTTKLVMCTSGATCLPLDCCFSELTIIIQLNLQLHINFIINNKPIQAISIIL
jgi:hypothetical protein